MPQSSAGGVETLQHVSIKLVDTDQEIFYSNLSLQESMLNVGSFSFIWKNEIIDDYTDDQEQFIREYIGKMVLISFEDHHTFKGIILEINYFQNDGLTQEFNIIGKGVASNLVPNTFNSSYSQQSLREIIDSVMPSRNSQFLNIVNEPVGQDVHAYIVQSNESDFTFMVHLAIRFGEWFYYDGEQLQFGKLFEELIELQANTDVFNVCLSSQLPSMILSSSSYDPVRGEIITATSETPSSQGLASSITTRSGEVYVDRSGERSTYLGSRDTESGLTEALRLEMEARTSRMITFSARSRNSHLKLGQCIKITNGNKSNEYIIVNINHTSNSYQNYQNDFVAIPRKVKVPHYTNPNWCPTMQTHSAMVIDNEDPEGLDRIKVRFVWDSIQSAENRPWLRIQNPYSGQDRGFRFIPELQDEVMIGFENGNAEKPYVIGAMFHGGAQSGHNREGNHIKIFRTRSGARFMMNDEDGSIKLTDKAGSYIKLCGNGDIEIIAANNLKIQAGENCQFEVAEDSNYVVGSNLSESIGSDRTTDIGSNSNTSIGAGATLDIAQNFDISVGQAMSASAGMNLELNASMDFKANGDMNLKLSGGIAAELKGGATADIKAAMSTVSGDAMTTIKGGFVMIN